MDDDVFRVCRRLRERKYKRCEVFALLDALSNNLQAIGFPEESWEIGGMVNNYDNAVAEGRIISDDKPEGDQ